MKKIITLILLICISVSLVGCSSSAVPSQSGETSQTPSESSPASVAPSESQPAVSSQSPSSEPAASEDSPEPSVEPETSGTPESSAPPSTQPSTAPSTQPSAEPSLEPEPSEDNPFAPPEEPTGPLMEELQAIFAAAGGNENLPWILSEFVKAANSENYLGVSTADFNAKVKTAIVSYGAMMTSAFQVAIVDCNSEADAKAVRDSIKTGFNMGRWICVHPEEGYVTSSGTKVLMFVGTVNHCTHLKEAALQSYPGATFDSIPL